MQDFMHGFYTVKRPLFQKLGKDRTMYKNLHNPQ